MNTKFPFMSIVVITFNGEAVIARALESLLVQDYPRDRFEIIVVDDGSTDRTGSIVRQFAVRYHYKSNGGISSARSAGLQLATGDVYVCFDDDCYVDKDWLTTLAAGYITDHPLGVSGTLVSGSNIKTLVDRYMQASNIEPAERVRSGGLTPNPLINRFIDYYRSNFKYPSTVMAPKKLQVEELYGANSSYDMQALREVRGWDEYFSGIEDRALCKLLATRNPDRTFYCVSGARIHHDPHLRLLQYLLRPYRRGVYNLRFYRTYRLFPPFFPFPFVYGTLLIASLLFHPLGALIVAVLAPLALYCWWIHYAITTKSAPSLLFAYIQLAEELMVILGLLRGVMTQKRRSYVAR